MHPLYTAKNLLKVGGLPLRLKKALELTLGESTIGYRHTSSNEIQFESLNDTVQGGNGDETEGCTRLEQPFKIPRVIQVDTAVPIPCTAPTLTKEAVLREWLPLTSSRVLMASQFTFCKWQHQKSSCKSSSRNDSHPVKLT